MKVTDEKDLSEILLKDTTLRLIEPHIYSLLSDTETGSSYDKPFGNFYDWVACNPLYNRIVWGYSIGRFAEIARNALMSSKRGCVLDIGCGSLAFTAKTYIGYSERPVILMDNSIKLLRIAKSRLAKINGSVPENMVFFHGDALRLPFAPNTFDTIICMNLLHVLQDIKPLLTGLKNILTKSEKIYFTTLVKAGRMADKYLELWENKGEVKSRSMEQLQAVFDESGMPVKYELNGNMVFAYYEGN